MAVLGGELDGIGAVDGVQPLREVGVNSGRTIGAEPANAPCDGVTDGVREAVGLPEMEVEGEELGLYDMPDAELADVLQPLIDGMQPEDMPVSAAEELLGALEWSGGAEAQALGSAERALKEPESYPPCM